MMIEPWREWTQIEIPEEVIIIGEQIDWLIERVGCRGFHFMFTLGESGKGIYHVKDPNIAMLFKLTFV